MRDLAASMYSPDKTALWVNSFAPDNIMQAPVSYVEISIGPLGSRRRVLLEPQVNTYYVGRAPTVQRTPSIGTIVIDSQASAVSDNHVLISRDFRETHQWKLDDLQSTNGCFRNGIRVRTAKLADMDEIWLGPVDGAESAQLIYHNIHSPELTRPTDIATAKRFTLEPNGPNVILVGKSVEPDQLQLFGQRVDDLHAVIIRSSFRDRQIFEIKHVGKHYDTRVNGQSLSPHALHQLADGDELIFGDCSYIVRAIGIGRLVLIPPREHSSGSIWAEDLVYSVRLDLSVWLGEYLRYGLRKFWRGVRGKSGTTSTQLKLPERHKTLLSHVDITIGPGDFIVLAGASGSGKTTLMRSLSTVICPQQGTLEYLGHSYKEAPDVLRPHIGYVPQDDIVHEQLTVYDELRYAAELRLPADLTKEEREERVQEVLRQLRLTSQTRQPIKKLSGGQRKRVNIAVELLSKPSILFLDEPIEGQDSALEESIVQLLRQLANAGTAIVLVSHRLNFLEYADYVGWMGPGGNMVYFGPPDQLASYFKIPAQYSVARRYAEIYKRIENLPNITQFSQDYKRSQLYDAYVRSRRRAPTPVAPQGQARSRDTAMARPPMLRQFGTLYRRQWSMVFADLGYLIVMLVVAIFGGLLMLWLADKGMFLKAQRGDILPAQQVLFPLSFLAVLIGVIASMRELVKDRNIYRRERMVGLSLSAYLLSKIAVLSSFGVIQCAIFVGMLVSATNPEPPGVLTWGPLEIYFTTLLTYFAGMSLGLLLSASVRTQEQLMQISCSVLIPQFLLSKALGFTLTVPASWIAPATFTYWALEALGDSGGLHTAGDPNFTGANYDPTANHLLFRWAVILSLACGSLLVARWAQQRQDRFQGG